MSTRLARCSDTCAQLVASSSASLSRDAFRLTHSAARTRRLYIFSDCAAGQQRTSCSSPTRLCGNNVVRAFDVRTGRLDARDAYTPPNGEYVNDVAYSAESDSLFVATYHIDESGVSVRSLRRTDGQWSECHRMQLAPEGSGWIWLRVLRDGTLLCSQWGTDGIHVCRAHSDRSLQHCARVALPATHMRIRRTARRQREAAGGRSFGRLSGPLPRRHRARRTRAALQCTARRRPIRSVLRRQSAGRSGHWWRCAGGSVVHDDWRPPAARPPTHSPRRPTRHIALVFRRGDAVCVGLQI